MIRAGIGAAVGALRGVLLDSPLSRAGSGVA
ncbi:Fe-S oxidoreductase, partial [Clavibacter michiganensis subsp. insidiosus]